MTVKKRGRPVGSKNKKVVKRVNIDSFAKTLKEWDELEKKVNWEEVAKKQESKLSAYIQENDQLATICIERWQEIQHLKYLVAYLESRNANPAV